MDFFLFLFSSFFFLFPSFPFPPTFFPAFIHAESIYKKLKSSRERGRRKKKRKKILDFEETFAKTCEDSIWNLLISTLFIYRRKCIARSIENSYPYSLRLFLYGTQELEAICFPFVETFAKRSTSIHCTLIVLLRSIRKESGNSVSRYVGTVRLAGKSVRFISRWLQNVPW